MKVDIRLANSGCRKKGFMAGLEADEGAEQIEICLRSSARSACLLAAQRLRSLADRFERLAREEKPESAEVQLRINTGGARLERATPLRPDRGRSAIVTGRNPTMGRGWRS